MQNKIRFLTPFLLLLGVKTLAQTSTPTAPEQVSLANLSVRFDADARRIVQQDVDALLANRQYWTAKLDRIALYFPLIESILIEEGVPADFKYLAVQESSLTPDAVSSSSAVGYWQFKRETATSNGMRVDDEIDERKSITASTHGAAQYLKKNNGLFNNWVSALYSYYLGPSNIARLVPSDWPNAREVVLDGRTDRYILRFFAHKIAIESALKFHQASNRFALIEYPNGGGKTIPAIAEELGVDEFELRKYNRWVLGETVPTDKTYVMAIPVMNDQINDVRQKIVSVNGRKTPDFVQNDVGFPVLRRVTTGAGSRNDPALYEINGLPGIQAQAGDNAASLARRAKISVSSFLRYNDLNEGDPILAKDIYYLGKKRRKALVPFHTVRNDETVRSISQRYAIRLKKLLRYNRLNRTPSLAVGRVMWLRERRPANKPVEIINAPTAPVYDQTPTAVREVAGVANRTVSGSEGIPRTASERRLYQPKLVGGGVTPNDGTSEPATVQRSEPLRPVRQSVSAPSPTRPATPPVGVDGSQRVVIVRSSEPGSVPANRTEGPSARPLYPASPDQVPDRKTVDAAPVTANTPARSRPTRPSVSEGRPATERTYDGPREQQADGSLTTVSAKAPPRPPAPDAVKPEPRPVPASPIIDEKPTAPAAPVTDRPTPAAVVPVNRTATTHTVEPGQTYYSISKLYGLTVDELLAMNNLTTTTGLEAGQRLNVRAVITDKPVLPSRTTLAGTPSGTAYHTVMKGETMFRISKIYGVTIEQIQEWNKLTDVTVKEGQKLRIREGQ